MFSQHKSIANPFSTKFPKTFLNSKLSIIMPKHVNSRSFKTIKYGGT